MKAMMLGRLRSTGSARWFGRDGDRVLPLLLVLALLAGCGGAPATVEVSPTVAGEPTATGSVATPLASEPTATGTEPAGQQTATAGSATPNPADTPATEGSPTGAPTEAPAGTATVAPSAEAPTAEATAQESPLQQHDVPPEGVNAVLIFPTYVVQCRPDVAQAPGGLIESQASDAVINPAAVQAQGTPRGCAACPVGRSWPRWRRR